MRLAICALSPSSDNSYLAYPSPLPSPSTPYGSAPSSTSSTLSGGNATGDVLIFDAVSLSVTLLIRAHKSPVSHLALNSQGTLVATASDKGTVTRVFSLPAGDKVAEFRRGSYSARIYSVTFNSASTLLCVASDTETVHIFKLSGGGKSGGAAQRTGSEYDDPAAGRYSTSGGRDGSEASIQGDYSNSATAPARPSLSGSLRKRSLNLGRNLVGGLLPGSVMGLWEPQRDFAFLKLPTAGVRSVVALSSWVVFFLFGQSGAAGCLVSDPFGAEIGQHLKYSLLRQRGYFTRIQLTWSSAASVFCLNRTRCSTM